MSAVLSSGTRGDRKLEFDFSLVPEDAPQCTFDRDTAALHILAGLMRVTDDVVPKRLIIRAYLMADTMAAVRELDAAEMRKQLGELGFR